MTSRRPFLIPVSSVLSTLGQTFRASRSARSAPFGGSPGQFHKAGPFGAMPSAMPGPMFGSGLAAPTLNQAMWLALAAVALMLLAGMAFAAGTGGTALQSAYTAVNDMVNGYGKQLLTVIGFGVAAIGYMAANSTGIVMKFIGFAVFLSVGLAAAVGMVGALV